MAGPATRRDARRHGQEPPQRRARSDRVEVRRARASSGVFHAWSAMSAGRRRRRGPGGRSCVVALEGQGFRGLDTPRSLARGTRSARRSAPAREPRREAIATGPRACDCNRARVLPHSRAAAYSGATSSAFTEIHEEASRMTHSEGRRGGLRSHGQRHRAGQRPGRVPDRGARGFAGAARARASGSISQVPAGRRRQGQGRRRTTWTRR